MNSCLECPLSLSSYSVSLFYGKIMGFDIYLAILFILDAGKLFCENILRNYWTSSDLHFHIRQMGIITIVIITKH